VKHIYNWVNKDAKQQYITEMRVISWICDVKLKDNLYCQPMVLLVVKPVVDCTCFPWGPWLPFSAV